MSKNVTIKDIAAEAGVSIALVSFVMNNRIEADGKQKYRVGDSTKRRIMEVAERLGYHPNSAARTLRNGRSKVIGAVFSDISNVFYGEIAREMENLAFDHGYTVCVGSTDEDPVKLDRIVRSFIDKGVDGFIVVPCEGSKESIKHILKSNIPLVFLDRSDIDLPAPKIVLNNRDAMKKAVMLLEGMGAKTIEMLSFTMRVSSITEREEGFIARMRECGFKDSEIRIHRIPFHNQIDKVRDAIVDIRKRGVDGLVFATNYLTVSSIKVLNTMGVKMQKDIKLVGFDNSDVYELFNPQIPYIKQPITDMCALAIDYMFGLINNEILQECTEISLEGEAIVPPVNG